MTQTQTIITGTSHISWLLFFHLKPKVTANVKRLCVTSLLIERQMWSSPNTNRLLNRIVYFAEQ